MAQVPDEHANGVAVIGMACRFPGAGNVQEYWRNLRDGVESISFFSDEELLAAGVKPETLSNPAYVKAKPIVERAEWFDAAFFRISPSEAEIMDPQHRVLLECAWEVLENAGYNPLAYKGRIGIYAGTDRLSYAVNNLVPFFGMASGKAAGQYLTENDKDYLCTRIAYKLNLRGPSMAVQTACSTALFSVHLACESLLTGECDMALAGGASISAPLKEGYFYTEGGLLSPDGHCRSFDARAEGTVFGNGVGIVALKRLEEAIADRDFIHAVIRGSAINNDGALRVGFTAPGVQGQAAVITEAMEVAGVDPETIGYIEAHGSGTPLGDLVEITALNRAFRAHTGKKGFCAIGSAKTSIGHVSTAAGAAGLIKTVLSLEHKQIPPSLNFERPNPKIDFDNSPFFVNTALREWNPAGFPRRAGVNSFGMGGANAHIVLEEAPEAEPSGRSRPNQLLLLSARSASALEAATDNLVNHIRTHPELTLADVCHTLQVGRASFGHRRMMVCRRMDEAVEALAARDPGRIFTVPPSAHEQLQQAPSVTFMFPGVGDHYPGMGLELYRTEPVFQEWIHRCAGILQPYLGCDLLPLLFPPSAQEKTPQDAQAQSRIDLRKMLGRDQGERTSAESLQETWLAQPAVFVVEYALAQLMMSWGIRPRAMIGYSVGEYVAACLAEVMSLEDALRLVARRARMIQSVEPGAMLTVALSEADARAWLSDRVALSGLLTPSLSVLAGPSDAIEEVAKRIAAQGIACRRLSTTHAFHSPMMCTIQEACVGEAQTVRWNPPRIPYLSNVTGDWITVGDATDPGYWARHLCQPVRLSAGLARLMRDTNQVLLEVGPGRSLGSFAQQQPDCDVALYSRILPTLPFAYEDQPDSLFLLKTLGKLWLAGVEIDWQQYSSREDRRLPLPSYPFEREKYWLEPEANTARAAQVEDHPAGKKKDAGDWFYYPAWVQTQLHEPLDADALKNPAGPWLLFLDQQGCGAEIAKRLKESGQKVFSVEAGPLFKELGRDAYSMDPARPEDYHALLQSLPALPAQIIHCWAVDTITHGVPRERFSEAQRRGFYSIAFLIAALGRYFRDFRLWCLASNVQAIASAGAACPEKATALALCLVAGQENPNIACHAIDLEWPGQGRAQAEWLILQLMAEFIQPAGDANQGAALVAYRGLARWRRVYEPQHLEPSRRPAPRHGGVYLITGGLGAIGMLLAGYLAENFHAKLILTGRSMFPPRTEWPEWRSSHGEDDPTSCKIRAFCDWESHGAEIRVVQADAADEIRMAAAVELFGRLDGVFHAAGIVSPEFSASVRDLSREQAEAHFAPKVYGLYVLEKVLAGKPLDFCLLFSSLSSVLGGLGLGAYAAANAFMDAFASVHNSRHPQWWSVVNWDAWPRGDGQPARIASAVTEFEMSHPEALEALQRALSHARAGQLVNSTGDLQVRLDKWVRRVSPHGEATTRLHKRPDLIGPYVPPSNEIEKRVAEIWQQFLGISPIGIRDNFFELGGQSLLAVQIISRLQELLQIELPLTAFVQIPTVAALAQAINEILTEKALEQIANYSEEEAERLVNGEMMLENARTVSED